ncbi:MAG: hypothetical protein WC445_00740 [Patescibacteria group bacterium]
MSDEFKMTTGQAHELAMAFGRNGWTNADVKKMSEGNLLTQMLLVVRGQAEVKMPSSAVAAEFGYTVVEDVEPTLKSVGDLEFLSFLREGEFAVDGKTMRRRAVEAKANLGLADLKLVLAHRAEIPEEMRKFYLVFPGTVLRYMVNTALNVAGLRWHGGLWVVSFRWLDDEWRDRDRLVRRK